jgi:hypothetical protein
LKILIASSIDPDAITALEQEHDVIRAFNADTEHLRTAAADREVIVFRSGVQLSEHVLDGAPNLQLLVRAGSDLDNVDLGVNPRDPAHQAQGRRRRPAHRIDRPHLRARPNEGGHCAGRVRRMSPQPAAATHRPSPPTALFPTDQRRSPPQVPHTTVAEQRTQHNEQQHASGDSDTHPKDGNTRLLCDVLWILGHPSYQGGPLSRRWCPKGPGRRLWTRPARFGLINSRQMGWIRS